MSLREGNGNPLQYSCLGDPTDGGAWWVTVHGVTKSRARLSRHIHCEHTSQKSVRCEGVGGERILSGIPEHLQSQPGYSSLGAPHMGDAENSPLCPPQLLSLLQESWSRRSQKCIHPYPQSPPGEGTVASGISPLHHCLPAQHLTHCLPLRARGQLCGQYDRTTELSLSALILPGHLEAAVPQG